MIAKTSRKSLRTASCPSARDPESPLEFVLRHMMHDIIAHTFKHWNAFSSAAQQVNVTPAQALASVLTKATVEVLENAGNAATREK